MYVTFGARPLPKWFHLILSVLLFNLSCAIVYVYIMTRNITTSTDRFETVPSYVVAVLFFMSGCLSLAMTKSVINDNLKVAQFGVALSLITIAISLAAVICTLWLADVQDKFLVCIYNSQHSQCVCRNDNATEAQDNNWFIYERITGCNRLDSLNRCMIASIALDAVGAFICFLAFANFSLIWARRKIEGRHTRSTQNSNLTGNTTLRHTIPRYSRTVSAGANVRADPNSGSPSPAITPGSHSDWDGWLFSHPLFRQMFTEFRHIWFPPTYEQSQTSTVPPTEIVTTTAEPQARTRACRVRSAPPAFPEPTDPSDSVLNIDGDYPPPPYSKAPKRKYGTTVPKTPEEITPVHEHLTPGTTSVVDTRTLEHVTSIQN